VSQIAWCPLHKHRQCSAFRGLALMLAIIAAAAHALSIPHRPSQCVLGRRGVLLATTAAVAFPSSQAAAEPPDDLVAVGSVRIKPGVAEPAQDGGALYVTVRVIPSNNVGTYVTAGKVPPLATARIASPVSFPYEVRLTLADLTPEYAGVPRKEWQQQDLTISARWDTDGTAATCAAKRHGPSLSRQGIPHTYTLPAQAWPRRPGRPRPRGEVWQAR
jgi:hypothetical protein